jgi:DNA polymerase-1
MSYAVVDVETTTKLSFKRKANAFDADNWVVYVGTKYAGEALSSAVHFKNREDNAGWLVKVLRDGIKIIVGHNPKFDILHAIAKDDANLSAWMRFIADSAACCLNSTCCLWMKLPHYMVAKSSPAK